jgi:hypothetical protein
MSRSATRLSEKKTRTKKNQAERGGEEIRGGSI